MKKSLEIRAIQTEIRELNDGSRMISGLAIPIDSRSELLYDDRTNTEFYETISRDEITDDINASNFTWTRKSKNASDDEQWNRRNAGGKKTITLTSSDVFGRSVFYCTVTLPDGTEVTGS